MRHPAYHLRPNKTADRFAFIEAIKRLERISAGGLGEYIYHGLGGPYLEDFRLLYELCPDIGMVSIEREEETRKRQEFHVPCSTLRLEEDDLTSYIARFDPGVGKTVFWLDYTGLEYSSFEDFKALLDTVAEDSMIKVTLRSEPKDYWMVKNKKPIQKNWRVNDFQRKFASVMTKTSDIPPNDLQDFAYFLQKMLRIAAEQTLTFTDMAFVPVSSFCYADGAGMFTLTGVVCEENRKELVERAFDGWDFANLTWSQPKLIDMPVLSTKERLHLQHLLPSDLATGRTLRETLGYLIDDDILKTESALEQYAAFHRYSPYFLRGVP